MKNVKSKNEELKKFLDMKNSVAEICPLTGVCSRTKYHGIQCQSFLTAAINFKNATRCRCILKNELNILSERNEKNLSRQYSKKILRRETCQNEQKILCDIAMK